MVARLFYLGTAIGLSFLASLGLSPLTGAHAANPAWSTYAAQSKRPQFRPWNRAVRNPVSPRWRPQTAAPAQRRIAYPTTTTRAANWSGGYRARPPAFSGDPVGARKAARVTRANALGLSFRPDKRVTAAVPAASVSGNSHLRDTRSVMQSQFRPARAKRRGTYEELQAGNPSNARMAAQVIPVQMIPGLAMGGYGLHWQTW